MFYAVKNIRKHLKILLKITSFNNEPMDTGTPFIIIYTTLSSLPSCRSSAYTHLKESISQTVVSGTLTGGATELPRQGEAARGWALGSTAARPLSALYVDFSYRVSFSGRKVLLFKSCWKASQRSLAVWLSKSVRAAEPRLLRSCERMPAVAVGTAHRAHQPEPLDYCTDFSPGNRDPCSPLTWCSVSLLS